MTPQPTPYGRNRVEHPLDAVDEAALLDLLTDDRCQAILDAVTEEAHTAGELIDDLDIPRSTLYRKVDALTDANLLAEQTRIDANGNHESQYVRQFEVVSFEIDFGSGLEIRVADGEPAATDAHPTIGASAD